MDGHIDYYSIVHFLATVSRRNDTLAKKALTFFLALTGRYPDSYIFLKIQKFMETPQALIIMPYPIHFLIAGLFLDQYGHAQ